AFLDDAGNAFAVLPSGFLLQTFEYLLEPFNVSLRFLEMRFKGGAQISRRGCFREPRKCLDQLFFRIVGVAQFFDECVVQGSRLSHLCLLYQCGYRRYACPPGFMTTLMQSSCLSRNTRYISGASSSVTRCVM